VTRAEWLIENARPWSNGALVPGADAIAVGGGKVLGVGPAASLAGLRGPATRRLDAGGATVTPGICDAHLHLVSWARARRELALEGAGSRRAALERVARFCAERPGEEPVIGRGWDEHGWEAPPDRASLDAVSGGRVVILHRKDFHAVWVNGAALAAASITSSTPEPEGGKIERLPSGEPSGIFREHAVRLFRELTPPVSRAADLPCCRDAAAELLSRGITSVHVFEAEREAEVLETLAHGAGPRVRVLMHLPAAALDRAPDALPRSGEGDDWFRWGAVKLFADGTLGSRTAALLEPYDGTRERGMELSNADELKRLTARAFARGLSIAIHAIGDRAVRSCLDAIESAGPAPGLPPRIEHAQLVHPADLPRFAALGVAASMQPQHCTADAPLVRRWWASRAAGSYPWAALLASGALLAFGSDAPVEAPVAAWGLHAAVTRCGREGGEPAPAPEQKTSLDQALTAYTAGPARLAGLWPRFGRLAVGSVADLVIWNGDLHSLPPERLAEIRPASTLLGGEVGFVSAGSLGAPVRSFPGAPR
jgi:predicted amidohydrolase YtcJ